MQTSLVTRSKDRFLREAVFFIFSNDISLYVYTLSAVILSERSESKDLRTDDILLLTIVRRSLDSISFRSG